MTVIEVIDTARALLKDPLSSSRTFPDDTTSFFKDTDLLNFFNFTQNEVQNRLVESFENFFVTSTSINIVNGTDEYSMPSDCLKVVRLELIEGSEEPEEIFPMSFNEKEFYSGPTYVGVTSVGDITRYAIKGNSFVFRPKPDRSITSGVKVYYVKRLAALASGTSTSEIPVEYQELLVWGIVKRGLILQEATAEAMSVAISEFNRLLNEMTTNSEDRQIQRPRFVKRRKR